ncbi:MAG: fumarylacetoacetate hydrolase family protein [Holophagaceae bacterium]
MKLITFRHLGQSKIGAVISETQGIDFSQLDELIPLTMLELIEHHQQYLPILKNILLSPPRSSLFNLSEVELLSPIPNPISMRDAYAFRQHVATARKNRGLEMIPEFDLFPVTYFTNHLAVTGPGSVLVQEHHLNKLDYELEVAVVLGKPLCNATLEECDDAIFGYMIMNDWSARFLQMEEMKLSLGPAKGKDFATSLGPWLVTKDELSLQSTPEGNVLEATMKAFVNNQLLSEGNTKTMNWTFAQILQRTSYGIHLKPGEVIGSGTVGTGCLLELNGSKITNNLWLQVGDQVRMEIEGLGSLSNTVVRQEERLQGVAPTLLGGSLGDLFRQTPSGESGN